MTTHFADSTDIVRPSALSASSAVKFSTSGTLASGVAKRVVVAAAAFSTPIPVPAAIIAEIVIRGIIQPASASVTADARTAMIVARGIIQTAPAAAALVVRASVVVSRRVVGPAPAAAVVAQVVIRRVVRAAAPLSPVVARVLAGGIVLSAPGLNRRDANHQCENGKRERGCRTEYHGCVFHYGRQRAPSGRRFDPAWVTDLIYMMGFGFRRRQIDGERGRSICRMRKWDT